MSFSPLSSKMQKISKEIIKEIIKQNPSSFAEAEKIKNKFCEKFHLSTISNIKLLQAAQKENLPENIRKILQKRKVRTLSGVAVLTVLTKPFPCPGKCVFCPQEKTSSKGITLLERDSKTKDKLKVPAKFKKPGAFTMPKSYFSNEPAASRALLCNFDPFKQTITRLKSLKLTGHDTCKIEVIILGGTFSALSRRYRTFFVKRIFQALNGDDPKRKTTLQIAQKENESATHRAIALVVETRPDFVDKAEIKYLRKLGCTKVELGVQSLDDQVLKLCQRGHGKKESIKAIKLLKDNGFKVGLHMMPGLPGSNAKKDLKNFKQLFTDTAFRPDFLKIYPCTSVPFSELEKWEKKGKFTAITEQELFPLLLNLKQIIPRYVRISRLIRDIPATSITSGCKTTNLRQLLQNELKRKNLSCQCIRCREIKTEQFNAKKIKFSQLKFEASAGQEFFLSLNTENDKLIALLRLRINALKNKAVFKCLQKAALIRELHTYGTIVPIGKKSTNTSQHRGFGKMLLKKAEEIALKNNFKKIAVISGIGVKNFWRENGFQDDGYYLVKRI